MTMWGRIKIPKGDDLDLVASQLQEWGFPILWTEEGDDEWVITFDKVEPVSQEIDWQNQSEQHSPFYKDGFIAFEGLKLKTGNGFGDLSHPTTRLTLSLMKHLSGTVYDLGCGNGILACVAKKRGADTVFAWDIDQEALELAKENSRLNNLDIQFKPLNEAGTILVNMIFSEQKQALKGLTAEKIISSGILKEERESYLQFMNNYLLVDEIEEEGWLAFSFIKLK